MDDIDVTRKLRPPKPPDPASSQTAAPHSPPDEAAPTVALPPGSHPAPPPAPVKPLASQRPVYAAAASPPPLAQAKPAVPPPPVVPMLGAVPPPSDDVHTIRFSSPYASTGGSGQEPPPDPVTGWLVVMKGPGRGRSLPLGYGVHSVGRAEDQRVCVRFGDKKISRRSHVEVLYDGKGRSFYVGPGRGSTFGYLNNQPVLQPSPLRPGDRITLGDTELTFMPFCGEAFDWQQE